MPQSVRASVLVVEDNFDTREVLERVLAIQGYDVVAARDGIDALAYLRRGGMPSAIILDIAMPNMDGISFSRALRADARWTDIPVIIYTAMQTKRVPAAAAVFHKGSDDPQHLLDLLARVCQTRH
jgi:chemosensory pili system protein ChpA (sensor histidine kinase/response regulator)